MEAAWHALEDDIPDPRCLACEVDVVPAVPHTRPDNGCSKTPVWPDSVDDDSGTLYGCVNVMDVCNIYYIYWDVGEVAVLAYERLEL